MRARFVALLFVAALGSAACAKAPQRPDGQYGLLPVGAQAPDLEAVDVNGATTRLSALRGQAVVVYFYPHDATPGCTTEACAFRDAWDRLKTSHVAVIGVSSQSRDSHLAFQKDQHLPFPLVADENGQAQRAYGVPRGLFGDSRVSFLVDPSGKVAKVWPDVDPAVHADDVLAAAKALPQ